MFIYRKNKLVIKDLKKIILLKDNKIVIQMKEEYLYINGFNLSLGYYEYSEVHILGNIKEIQINEN